MKQTLVLLLAWLTLNLCEAETNSLTLVKTIPLPEVKGRLDHFAMDPTKKILFLAALGNGTVEELNLAAGKRSRTIKNCAEPQGLAYAPASNRLVVANGGSGQVNILDATSFKLLASIPDLPDADNVRYDAKADLAYVGYGEGGLAVIRVGAGELAGRIPLPAHPESFQMEAEGPRIFINVPGAKQVVVVDREQRKTVATWPLNNFHSNFPLALDEMNHRLFIGCRHPARLLVLDTSTGRRVNDLPIAGDTDDVFYDAKRKRIYVTCGSGTMEVVEQTGPASYRILETIKTASGARTGFFSPEQDELYLAIRAGMISGQAEVRVYRPAN